VAQRSLELDAANQALSKSEARLAWHWRPVSWAYGTGTCKPTKSITPRFRSCSAWSPNTSRRCCATSSHACTRRPAAAQAALVEHLKGRTEDYQIEYRVRHGDGHWVWIEDRGRAVERAENGRVIRMVGTRRDISASKALEEQQRLAATVFEAASEGIVIFDPDYALIAVNQAFSRVTGYEIEDMLGRNVVELPCSRDARRHYRDPPGAGAATAAGRANWWKPARTASCTRSGCN
jgi:hypothetical protein